MLTHRFRTILGDIPADWDAKPLRSLIAEHFAGDWGDDEGEQAVAVMRSTNFTKAISASVSVSLLNKSSGV